MVFIFALLCFLRDWNVRRSIRVDLEESWREYERVPVNPERAVHDWWRRLELWAEAVGDKRRTGEALPDLGRRLLRDRGWDRLSRDVRLPPPPAEM